MSEKQNRVLIITGGNLHRDFLTEYRKAESFDYIICVDSGLVVADACRIKMNCIIGDFDSVDAAVIEKYRTQVSLGQIQTIIKTLQPEKDMTDTQVAVETAVSLSPSEIVILGGTGSRMDHVLANINLLLKPLSVGIKACLIDEHNKIYLANKSFLLQREKAYGDFLSLLPFSERVVGVTLTGVKYTLNHYDFTQGDSIGISNEITAAGATVEFQKGTLVVIEAKD